MKDQTSHGACYRCGSGGQSGRFCRNCGAGLLSMASSPTQGTSLWGLAPAVVRGMAAVLVLALLVAGGFTAAVGFHTVSSSGICFANPLEHTSLWPYDLNSGALRLSYYFEEGPKTPYRQQYLEATETAFKAWSRAWPVLRFRKLLSPEGAQIVVKYGPFGTKGFWYNHAGLTLPDVNMFGCGLTHALIEINNSYLVRGDFLEYPMPMLRHLFLHEIGHALGLRHVYRPIASVMVPTSEAYRYVTPQPYDVHTLARLYPSSLSIPSLLTRRADVPPSAHFRRAKSGAPASPSRSRAVP